MTGEEATAAHNVCGKLVRQEVVWNVNELVQFLLSDRSDHGEFDYDDLCSLTQSVDWETTVDNMIRDWDDDERREMLADAGIDTLEEDLAAQCRRVAMEDVFWVQDKYNPEPEYVDALEYWAVTKWFAEKLAENGESVMMDLLGFHVWGRTCSGQAIALDGVVRQIASDMEILPGQKYSWA